MCLVWLDRTLGRSRLRAVHLRCVSLDFLLHHTHSDLARLLLDCFSTCLVCLDRTLGSSPVRAVHRKCVSLYLCYIKLPQIILYCLRWVQIGPR